MLINLLTNEWKKEIYFNLISRKSVNLTCGQVCHYFDGKEWKTKPELVSNQEEADPRMVMHSYHASIAGFQDIVIHTPDTDVFIIMLSFLKDHTANLYMKTGRKGKTRIIDIQAVKKSIENLKSDELETCNILEALPGLHAFTGCDTVSAFSNKAKIKALNIMLQSEIFVHLFQSLGTTGDPFEEIFSLAKQFVCAIYGYKDGIDVNLLRYKIYCSKRGKMEADELPPCRSSLRKDIQRANYQTKIWRLSLDANHDSQKLNLDGWKMEGEELEIDWMDCKPVPDEVFFFLSLTDSQAQCPMFPSYF